MTIIARLDTDLDAATGEVFDRFMASSPFAAYQQTRVWADVAPRRRMRDYLFFTCRRGDAFIGAAVIRRTRLGRRAWLATIQRGPVVHQAAHLDSVLAELRIALAAAGCCSLQLAPRAHDEDGAAVADALRRHRFTRLPDHRQSLHVVTGVVALDRPEDAILAGFKQRGRRQLKLAAQAGVVVRPVGSREDVAAYQSVLDDFRTSRPDYDMRDMPDAAGQATLVERLGGGMLLAELDGEVIGGHAFVRQGGEAVWLSLATSADRPAVPRSYPLLWNAMRAARALGCVGYDLAGLPFNDPRDPGEAGRAQFKTAFAPLERVMPAMHVAPLRLLPHLLLFGSRQIYRDIDARRRRPATMSRHRGSTDARA